MMKINYNDLRMYTYSNDTLIQGEIKGIVIQFTGLNGTSMWKEDPEIALRMAKEGIVFLFPYINPWAWMNRDAVTYTDAVVDTLFEHYELREPTPIISTGGSMGGLCGLVYTRYAKRTPKACAVNCPVCDLPYHYTERPDLPRTLVSAFGSYDMSLEDAMKTASPMHLVNEMPDVPYLILHCDKDMAVNKEKHSDRLVQKLSEKHNVTYVEVPDRGHCDLSPEAKEIYEDFMISMCK